MPAEFTVPSSTYGDSSNVSGQRRGQADLINRSLSRVRDVMTERAGVVLPLSRSNATQRNAIRGVVVCQLPNISYRVSYRDLRCSRNRLINGHRLTIDNSNHCSSSARQCLERRETVSSRRPVISNRLSSRRKSSFIFRSFPIH